MTTVGCALRGAHSEATLGEVEAVACSNPEAVEVGPLNELRIDSALKNEIFEEASDFVVDEGGENSCSLAEAATKSAGDVVFAAAFPGLELTGSADASVTGIETEHDFAHRNNVVGAGVG